MYEEEIKRLEYAIKRLQEAARLEALGGPRRTRRALDQLQFGYVSALQVGLDLQKVYNERIQRS